MSNIDVFIRHETGERMGLASLNSADEVRDLHELLREVGVSVGGDVSHEVVMQAIIDDDDAGFEFIVMF